MDSISNPRVSRLVHRYSASHHGVEQHRSGWSHGNGDKKFVVVLRVQLEFFIEKSILLPIDSNRLGCSLLGLPI